MQSMLFLTAFAVLVMAVLAFLRSRTSSRSTAGTWPLHARKAMSVSEQVLYLRLLEALPERIVLARFSAQHGVEGFDRDWLRSEPLEVRPRGGGERFKPHAARPSRTLKRLFQDAGIPEFERGRLPLLWRKDELIYVGGLGADVRLTDRHGERIVIAWQPDAGLIDHAP